MTEVAVRQVATGRLKAAWTLILLAPLCAEAAFSGISLPVIWAGFPLLIPIYGAGVLLARELVCRTGTGWPGLLLLGFAYELTEDGLGLQALTSPHLYSAATWGRAFGVNFTYWESQVGYHLVFTVLIPVVLTSLIFKRHGNRPYLGWFGLSGTAVVFVLGVVLVRFLIPGTQDPGYHAPMAAVVALVAGIVVLGVVALAVVPRLRPVRVPPAASVPRPALAAAVGLVAPFVFLGLIFPVKADSGPAIGEGAWVLIPMAAALVFAVAAGVLVARWCATESFTDRHRLWLITGALAGHSLWATMTGIVNGQVVVSLAIGLAVLAVTVGLPALLDRRLSGARAG